MQEKENQPKPSSHRFYYALGLRIAADLSVTIAIPAIIGAWVGTRLDARHQTEPWLLLLCLAFAFALTVVILVKKAKYYKRLYEKADRT